jgi:penicillin-binding protein 1A
MSSIFKVPSNQKKYIKYIWILIIGPILFLFLLVASIGFGLFGQLPSFEELENPNSLLASEVYSSDLKTLGKYFRENRVNIHYKDLSPNLVNALKATEDVRFEEHSGVDIRGLFRVIVRTIILQQDAGGGSTLTQQLAKNLFPRGERLSKPGLIIRKIKEWIIAVKLERNYTKQEILAMYLNTVEFGNNAFGIKSACTTYFQKDTKEVNQQECIK